MKKPDKKINKGLIVMSKGERIGVISLLSVITILLAFSVFRPAIKFSKQNELAKHNLDSMIALQQKVNRMEKEEEASSVSTSSVKPTGSARPTGSTRTTRSDKPAKTEKPVETKVAVSSPAKAIPILDINRADSSALVALPQIGEVMASRIHRYRDRLGGFVSFDQLFEVKGMDSTRFATIKPYIVLEVNDIRKLEVNRDEFKVLLRHPYLEYDQVKAIVNHRERKGLIRNWDQLRGITGEVNPLLESYVVF